MLNQDEIKHATAPAGAKGSSNVKTQLIRTLLGIVATAMLALPSARAEDIDIFGGFGGAAVPNILFVVDSRASNDATVSPYTCSYAPLSNGKMLQMVQCALYMAILNINSQPALSGKVSMSIMVAGPRWYYPSTTPYNFTLMDPAGVSAITTVLKNDDIKTPGNGSLGEEMYEAWAFFTGHTGPLGINYSSHIGTLSCQKSFIIIVGNVDDKHDNPSNSAGGNISDLQNAIPTPTATQLTKINTSNLGPDTGEDNSSIDEWSRYLFQTDFNNNANDRQGATTYTIGTYGSNVWPDKAQQMESAAKQGGGKSFFVNNIGAFTTVLNQIFNEIAAVNSVFASSSLPISANNQGTYLNQVFVGMFRPDGSDNPRWMGNLKQYQFGVGGTTANPTLFLADATGAQAISGAGTGFISATAKSFWSSKDTSKLPDSAGGFWVNNPQSSSAGFDWADGEIVEKGGVGQQVRLENLQSDYTKSPGSLQNPRRLYTCNGFCTASDSLSATPFATTNTAVDTTALGITGNSSSASSISRNGTTVTMVLSAAPSTALTNGQAVTVTGASNIEINGTFTITLVNSTTFTYTITESPPTPSTGTYSASIPSTPTSVSALTRIGTQGMTASATTASAHGFAVNQKVTISGATQSEYNGLITILTVPTATTFTYAITPGPAVVNTVGTAAVGASNLSLQTGWFSLDTINNASPYSRIVTINTGATLPTAFITSASVTIAGVVPATYTGTYPILYGKGSGDQCPGMKNKDKDNAFCYTINSSPTFPATGTIVADPSASATIAAGGLTHTTSCTGGSPTPNVTVSATASAALPATFVTGTAVTVTGAPGTRESLYLGSKTITKTGASTFTFPVTTTPPCAPSAANVQVLTSASSISRDSLINWVRGYDSLNDELSPSPGTITIRPSVHGDTLHSRPTVVNYGGSTGVVVFYGANDGVFRAINGNQPLNGSISIGSSPAVPPGGELWGFVPTEFYGKLKRLYANSPMVLLSTTPNGFNPTPTPKDYFFDGSTGVYQDTATSTVSLFLSARRGGRLIYALNVNNPTDPKFLWKKTNADIPELGYTFSAPKAARVRGYNQPVVIFAGGYDPIEDDQPPGTDTMGRGIYILDATNGNLVWKAEYSGGGGTSCTGNPCQLSGMTYAIPADLTLVNRDFDTNGYVDRIYAADLGGNIWRVDLEPAGYGAAANAVGPSTWQVTKFASLGGSGTTKRKFFYPPDVVATKNFDMVMAATGDREHPMYNASSTSSYAIVNRFYGLKDKVTGPDASAAATITDGTSSTADATVTGLTTATSATYNPATNDNGFYITFSNAGEKAVNSPVTVGGYTYVGTSTPPAPSSQACNNLGTARGYQVNFLTGAKGNVIFDGGGLPPSPVAGLVNVDVGGSPRAVPFCLGCGNPGPSGGGPDAKSPLGGGKPPIPVPPIRKRVYWYIEKHDT